MNLKTLSLDTDEIWLKILLYGPSGVGKTTLIGTFPGPIYLFDFDHKYKHLAGLDIELDSYDNSSKDKALVELNRFAATLKKVMLDTIHPTVVIDSMSTLDPLIQAALIKLSGRNLEYPDIGIYGHHADKWQWLVLELCRTGVKKNIVLIGHDQYKVDTDSSIHRICPLISGDKIQGKLPCMFEETYYYIHGTTAVGNKPCRKLYYRTTNKAIASSTVLTGPGYIEDPTYDKIMSEIRRSQKERIAARAAS